MAVAAKSNAGYVAYNAARAFVAQDGSREVPLHLRNAPTKLMKQLDYGKDYRYAHNEEGGYAAGENYFPDGMPAVSFYEPTERGLEAKISEKLNHLRQLDEAASTRHREASGAGEAAGTMLPQSAGSASNVSHGATKNKKG
jgi:putative ATPase